MYPRLLAVTLRQQLQRYPAVLLRGPRQCGKTVLAQSLNGRYYDLEDEADRRRVHLEWDDICADSQLCIFDEAQTWPEIFNRLRSAIDRQRHRYGRFLLLGSIAPSLMQSSQSLAGRLALLELTPFLLREVPLSTGAGSVMGRAENLAQHWLVGGFPDGGLLQAHTPPSEVQASRQQSLFEERPAADYPDWQRNYLRLNAEQDLPELGIKAAPSVTRRFMRLLADYHGQQWNASQIGRVFGLSYHTVNRYLDYLEGVHLVRRLLPLAAPLRKRLVKRPKVYWRDSGLLHSLLGIHDDQTLLAHPMVGSSWEGLVIEQLLGALGAAGHDVEDPFFFRTSSGDELDLVIDCDGRRWAVEITLSSRPSAGSLRALRRNAEVVKADLCLLVSQTTDCQRGDHEISCNLPWLTEQIAAGEI